MIVTGLPTALILYLLLASELLVLLASTYYSAIGGFALLVKIKGLAFIDCMILPIRQRWMRFQDDSLPFPSSAANVGTFINQ